MASQGRPSHKFQLATYILPSQSGLRGMAPRDVTKPHLSPLKFSLGVLVNIVERAYYNIT